MSASRHQEEFSIAATHPALPGHFPGLPIVPGVVLLDHVAAALQRWRGVGIVGLPQVKFLASLLPEQNAVVELESGATRIRFRVRRGDTLLACGEIETA
ncbi:MAG: hydroxymyristoyl-ACP dehydratase [Tahibacter sp.]